MVTEASRREKARDDVSEMWRKSSAEC